MVDRNAELRATVRRLESNAKRKIRRNERKGLGNVSAFSPIRPSMEVGSLNKRQLTVYQHQLQRFQSRKNQFLSDSNGEALPSQEWKKYKQRERKYSARVNAIYDEVKGLILPNGQSIADRMTIMTPDHPSMANQAVNALFRPPNREPKQVNGVSALKKLDKSLDRMLGPEYFDYRRNADKDAITQMLDMLGDDELKDRVLSLNDKQFDTLWNYTEFGD